MAYYLYTLPPVLFLTVAYCRRGDSLLCARDACAVKAVALMNDCFASGVFSACLLAQRNLPAWPQQQLASCFLLLA